MEETIINKAYRFGKNFFAQETTIREAQEGKIIAYSHPLGTLAVMSWEKYQELVLQANTK